MLTWPRRSAGRQSRLILAHSSRLQLYREPHICFSVCHPTGRLINFCNKKCCISNNRGFHPSLWPSGWCQSSCSNHRLLMEQCSVQVTGAVVKELIHFRNCKKLKFSVLEGLQVFFRVTHKPQGVKGQLLQET